jgi:hypothetical protein
VDVVSRVEAIEEELGRFIDKRDDQRRKTEGPNSMALLQR